MVSWVAIFRRNVEFLTKTLKQEYSRRKKLRSPLLTVSVKSSLDFHIIF